MAVYNEEDTVSTAVESILSQTYDEFEFIIVDDGSTDNTVEVLDGFTDSRISLIQNEHNRGLPFSLNRGLDAAQGDYIARMDADDRSLPSRLEYQVNALETDSDLQICGCWYRVIGAHNQYLGDVCRAADPEIDVKTILRDGPGVAHGSAMIRNPALDAVGGYDEQYVYGQDLDLWLRIGERYGPGFLRNVDRVLYERRIDPETIGKMPIQRLYGDFARTSALSQESVNRVPDRFLSDVSSGTGFRLSARKAKSRYHQKAGRFLADRHERSDACVQYLRSIRQYPLNTLSWYGLFRTVFDI